MVTRIVKIGGASITDKSQFEHVKLTNIDFIVDLFKNNYKNLILIHGAGSFGYMKKKLLLNERMKCISYLVIIKLNNLN
jgi:isopentenyl phosphate kinase